MSMTCWTEFLTPSGFHRLFHQLPPSVPGFNSTLTCRVSLVSSGLWQDLSLFLFPMILLILRSWSLWNCLSLVCLMFFLMIRLRSWILGRKPERWAPFPAHRIWAFILSTRHHCWCWLEHLEKWCWLGSSTFLMNSEGIRLWHLPPGVTWINWKR